MQKKCFKCQQVKDIDRFYKHPQMKDGHLGKCVECAKKDAIEHRGLNLDKIREYDCQRGKLKHRISLNIADAKIYRKKHKGRNAATLKLSRAVNSGKIIRPAQCQICKKSVDLMVITQTTPSHWT